jgi:hypothetical protein
MLNAHIFPRLQRKLIRTAYPTHEVVHTEEANYETMSSLFALNAAAAVASAYKVRHREKINLVLDLNAAPLRTIWG